MFHEQSRYADLYTELNLACDTDTAERLLELSGPYLKSLTLRPPLMLDTVLPCVVRFASPARLQSLCISVTSRIPELVAWWQARRRAWLLQDHPTVTPLVSLTVWTNYALLDLIGLMHKTPSGAFAANELTINGFAFGECSDCHQVRPLVPCTCLVQRHELCPLKCYDTHMRR